MKTKEEILEQLYITAQDLKILIPELGINNCVKVIKQMREEMEKRNMFVPNSRPLLAQTKLVIKKMGIWKEWEKMKINKKKIIDFMKNEGFLIGYFIVVAVLARIYCIQILGA